MIVVVAVLAVTAVVLWPSGSNTHGHTIASPGNSQHSQAGASSGPTTTLSTDRLLAIFATAIPGGANDISRLKHPDIAAEWQSVGRTTSKSTPYTPSSCSPHEPAPVAFYVEQWGNTDASGGIHGTAVGKLSRFSTDAQAQAYLDARTSQAYQDCITNDQRDILTKEGGVPSAPGVPLPLPQSNGGVGYRIMTPYLIEGNPCVDLDDMIWIRVGSDVMHFEADTCRDPWSPAVENQLLQRSIALLQTQHA